jgi:hypothetical protein
VDDVAAADVASIEVFIGNRPDNGPDLGPFFALPGDYARILGLVRGGAVDPQPLKWQGLGWLKVRVRAGEKFVVWLFWTRGEAGAYMVGRTYYRGCSDSEFIAVLADCAQCAAASKEAARGG